MKQLRIGLVAMALASSLAGCDEAGEQESQMHGRCGSYDGSVGSFRIEPGDSSVTIESAEVVEDDSIDPCGFSDGYLIDLSERFGSYDYEFELMFRPDDILYVFSLEVDLPRRIETGDVFEIDGEDIEAQYEELEGDPWQIWVASEGRIEILSLTDTSAQVHFEGTFLPDADIGGGEGTFTASVDIDAPFDPDYGRPD